MANTVLWRSKLSSKRTLKFNDAYDSPLLFGRILLRITIYTSLKGRRLYGMIKRFLLSRMSLRTTTDMTLRGIRVYGVTKRYFNEQLYKKAKRELHTIIDLNR